MKLNKIIGINGGGVLLWISVIFLNLHIVECFFDPISLMIEAGGVIASGIGYYFARCRMGECCDDNWIKLDYTGLKMSLEDKVHGQHLVSEIVLKALFHHMNKKEPKKALVMSFHGWTGVGKTLVSSIIAKHLYKEGWRSKYVHLFMSVKDFPHEDQTSKYQDNLRAWIRGNVSACERSLFIFDEVDKLHPGVLDAIKPFIDYNENVNRINFRKSIFIFLSNAGGRGIVQESKKFWEKGRKREDITMKDMEPFLKNGGYNEEGGLKHSKNIFHDLIDLYVPFLPLERRHVKQCIKDELKERNLKEDPNLVEKVADNLRYYPEENPVYSTSGCKRIPSFIDLEIEKSL